MKSITKILQSRFLPWCAIYASVVFLFNLVLHFALTAFRNLANRVRFRSQVVDPTQSITFGTNLYAQSQAFLGDGNCLSNMSSFECLLSQKLITLMMTSWISRTQVESTQAVYGKISVVFHLIEVVINDASNSPKDLFHSTIMYLFSLQCLG